MESHETKYLGSETTEPDGYQQFLKKEMQLFRVLHTLRHKSLEKLRNLQLPILKLVVVHLVTTVFSGWGSCTQTLEFQLNSKSTFRIVSNKLITA